MKKELLEELVFKDFLPVDYEDIEPYLIVELERLRKELVNLPDTQSEKDLLLIFEKSVSNFNVIAEKEELENTIDTEEREGLCAALYKMGEIVGLNEDTEYLDEWREW